MISKKFAFFAIGSMFVAGATLASNVTFGQRAVKWVAENFDFVGPLGGALSSVVKAPDYDRRAPVMGFQVGAAASGSILATAGQPVDFGGYNSRYGISAQAFSSRSVEGAAQGNGVADLFAVKGDAKLANKISFQNRIGENNSSINTLAKSFLRNGSLVDGTDLSSLLNGANGGLKGSFTSSLGAVNSVTTDSADIVNILAAATNGNPLVTGSVTGQSSNAIAQGIPNSPASPTTPATNTPVGNVPAPGVLGLLAIGLAALASTRRKA
jgi:hypothetical protein